MAISDADIKMLWGRAAGICSNPECHEDLTVIVSSSQGYNIGEMAHVIARKNGSVGGRPGSGSDLYDNLLLLCPTCHTRIDKAPAGIYPEALLHAWKSTHEKKIRKNGCEVIFETFGDLRNSVRRRLLENKSVWITFGPKSAVADRDPGSNSSTVWNFRKLDTIIPNNLSIINQIEANLALIPQEVYPLFLEFKSHARAFELNQYSRLDEYPLFPKSFSKVFGDE